MPRPGTHAMQQAARVDAAASSSEPDQSACAAEERRVPAAAPQLQVRIVVVDYCMQRPARGFDVLYSELQGAAVEQVPVVRIFGRTSTGETALVHIHQAFPYLYVRYDDDLPRTIGGATSYIHRLALGIEQALRSANVSGKQHVHATQLTRAKPFYGYSREGLFVKISLYKPTSVPKVATLLLAGVVMGRKFQPYEAHIPYLLQILVDNNLHGMGFLRLAAAEPRRRADGAATQNDGADEGQKQQREQQVKEPPPPPPQQQQQQSAVAAAHVEPKSTCQVEFDATVADILNRQDLCFQELGAASDDSRLVDSLVHIWRAEEQRRRKAQEGGCALTPSPVTLPAAPPRDDVPEPFPYEAGAVLRLQAMLRHDDASASASSRRRPEEHVVEAPRNSSQASGGSEDVPTQRLFDELHDALTWMRRSEPDHPDHEGIAPRRPSGAPEEGDAVVDLDLTQPANALATQRQLVTEHVQHIVADDPTLFREDRRMSALAITEADDADLGLSLPDSHEVEELLDWMKEGGSQVISQTQQPSGAAVLQQGKQAGHEEVPLGSQVYCGSLDAPPISCFVDDTTGRPGEDHGGSHATVEESLDDLEMTQGIQASQRAVEQEYDALCEDVDADQEDLEGATREEGAQDPVDISAKEGKSAGSEHTRGREHESWDGCRKPLRLFLDASDEDEPHGTEAVPEGPKAATCSPQNVATEPAKQDMALLQEPIQVAVRPGGTKHTDMEDMGHGARIAAAVRSSPSGTKVEKDDPPDSEMDPIEDVAAQSSEPVEVSLHSWDSFHSLSSFVCETSQYQLDCYQESGENNAAPEATDDDEGHSGPATAPVMRSEQACPRRASGRGSSEFHEIPGVPTADRRVRAPPHGEGKRRPDSSMVLRHGLKPPSRSAVMECMSTPHALLPVVNPVPFFHPLETRSLERTGTHGHQVSVESLPEFTYSASAGGRKSVLSQLVADRRSAEDGTGVADCAPGSFLKLIRVQRPPSREEVLGWLSYRTKESTKRRGAMKHGGRVLDREDVMDPNTGKLIPAAEACQTPEDSTNERHRRPPSPRYDEMQDTFLFLAGDGSNTAPSSCSVGQARGSVERATPGARTGLNPMKRRRSEISRVTPPTPLTGSSGLSQAGFRAAATEPQQLSTLSIEVIANCRGDLLPDPKHDAVLSVCMCLRHEDLMTTEESTSGNKERLLVLCLDSSDTVAHTSAREPSTDLKCDRPEKSARRLFDGLPDLEVYRSRTETQLFDDLVSVVRILDPDVLIGYEMQKSSLGYLVDRSETFERFEEVPFLRCIGRVPTEPSVKEAIKDQYGEDHATGIHVSGRIVLNVWRLMRAELKLNIYTAEAVTAHVLKRRIPKLAPQLLSKLFGAGELGGRWRCLSYTTRRARLNLELLEQLDLIGRTAELARVFGIDFFSVISRGSQYRVESMMVRLAHSQNFLMVSPSKEQVANQPAMECLPLVMEPESKYYTSPVVVLDFQSLYPSMAIAYNLCYSTCLGRVGDRDPSVESQFGATALALPRGFLTEVQGSVRISPNGIMYLKKEIVPGIVPRLLSEILDTRVMVKAAMKELPLQERAMQRLYNARQFGLKLIANVTYGYTSAGFSGRMPCAELADSIVQYGRETLERAIRTVEGHPDWGAKVVYGDTDSLFVLLEGRTRAEAFKIGKQIADEITRISPAPVKLKMEKVYHPCMLVTKKRYVGYAYEDVDQQIPVFDAKGIETVRRDACPAVAKTLERSLRILYETNNVAAVKAYLQRQWKKILSGHVSVQDFVFAKEVRLGSYSAQTIPPAAIVASKAMANDPRAEPRHAERVPYVVVHAPPGARLVDMVVSPHALIKSEGKLHLHGVYYITKQIIPAIQRLFALLGVDIQPWYQEIPTTYRSAAIKRISSFWTTRRQRAGTIDRFYLSSHCLVCDELCTGSRPLCPACLQKPQVSWFIMLARSARLESEHSSLFELCMSCGGGSNHTKPSRIHCSSLDCPVLYTRTTAALEHHACASALKHLGLGSAAEARVPPRERSTAT